jgi:type III restriction enzyme
MNATLSRITRARRRWWGAIKDGLERDGLGDLVRQIVSTDGSSKGQTARKIKRRAAFASTEIYLHKVMFADGDQVRDLDYETDVLSAIDWRGFDPQHIADGIPENAQAAEGQLQRIRLADDGDELLVGEVVAPNPEILTFDPAHAVRMISDIVPNPFVGREIVRRLLARLCGRGFDDDRLGKHASFIVEELRRSLEIARDDHAEALFKAAVAAGRIQFRLRLDGRNWRMPFNIETAEPESAPQLPSKTGGPLEKSLFAPVYANELNSDERDVAVYLDGEKALSWWHRNVARSQYGLQGWRKPKIYPDFVFAVQHDGKPKWITVLDTKGDQLDNLDTKPAKAVGVVRPHQEAVALGAEAGNAHAVGHGGEWRLRSIQGFEIVL